MLTYDHANRASQGARAYQEDSAAIWPSDNPLTAGLPAALPPDTTLLAVLADGMGGHAAGERASAAAIATIRRWQFEPPGERRAIESIPVRFRLR